MILNTKRIHSSFEKISRKSQTNAFKSFICRQEKATTAAVFTSLRSAVFI